MEKLVPVQPRVERVVGPVARRLVVARHRAVRAGRLHGRHRADVVPGRHPLVGPSDRVPRGERDGPGELVAPDRAAGNSFDSEKQMSNRILVTGGAGYVGSACLRHLLSNGFDAIAYDNLVQGHRESVPQGRLVVGDIADTSTLTAALKKLNADAVMHFAAATCVGESVDDPEYHYRNNIAGTLSLLNSMRSAGVKHPLVLGHEWLCRVLTENPRLRRLVPRVYGLGDLGQILDERVFDQAKQIIAYQRSTLDKFVPTRAYRDAARAISSHGFVLLIGEPASGKSTIASLLAVSAADEWKLNTVFADRPDVVQRHWNPNDPAQFFVIDDAFGATQYDQERVNLWNTLFPVISAAIHQGCRIIMTSRDYIFRRAQSELKISAFPLLENSRVIIHVEELSKSEKQQIVYNHMKLGDQPKWFKIRIKPFLSDVTELDIMLPEVARRLGASAFTRKLFLDKENVLDFFKRPHAFLKETLRTISVGEKAAIAVLFMHGGKISTPVSFIQADTQAISALGASIPQTRASFTNLEGSFLQLVPDGDRQLWQYRHPTIRDAFADIVAEDPEQLDIYLAGAPTDTMLGEVTCGNVYLQGARLIVPLERFHSVIKRLSDLADAGRWYRVESFLANRCSESFVRQYFAERPSDLLIDAVKLLGCFALFRKVSHLQSLYLHTGR